MVSADFRRQLEGYGLTTAKIFYQLPDYRRVLQVYVRQAYDIFPHFPELNAFLDFWTRELEGPIHSVEVSHSRLIKPAELKMVDAEFRLN